MLLTSQQVRERLGIGVTGLKNLVKEGKLTPANTHDKSKKKFFMKFTSKDVNAYIREHGTKRRKVKHVAPVPNVLARMAENLAELSAKIDALYNMWK